MVRVLYIRPKEVRGSIFKKTIRRAANYFWLRGQDGFLRGSLHAVFDVREAKFELLKSRPINFFQQFDAVFVSSKALRRDETEWEALSKTIRKLNIPRVLCVTSAHPSDLPENRWVEPFDCVLKREMFVDLDRYSLSPVNRDKLRATMLPCPLVPATRLNVRGISPENFGRRTPADAAAVNHDVFFSGATTSRERIEAAKALSGAGNLRLHAALQPRQYRGEVPAELAGPPLSTRRYRDAIRSSAVNLAIEGYGPLTFRHLEIWALAAFPLSSAGIREVTFPLPAVEGTHYVVYENADDLIDKIRFYVDNEAARQAVAQAGREMFAQHYSYRRHGEQIRKWLADLS